MDERRFMFEPDYAPCAVPKVIRHPSLGPWALVEPHDEQGTAIEKGHFPWPHLEQKQA
jgi:hypothetical protein